MRCFSLLGTPTVLDVSSRKQIQDGAERVRGTPVTDKENRSRTGHECLLVKEGGRRARWEEYLIAVQL